MKRNKKRTKERSSSLLEKEVLTTVEDNPPLLKPIIRLKNLLHAFLRVKPNTPKQMSFGGLKHPLKPFFKQNKNPTEKIREVYRRNAFKLLSICSSVMPM